MPTTATDQIRRRIENAEPGWVFTPADLLDCGSAQLVGMVLLKMVRSGQIRRLARGLYDLPKSHPKLGLLSASATAIARAIARRDGTTIQPSEAEAANLLHLSDQVPAKIAFDTDGPSKTVEVGRLSLRFQGRSRRKVGGIAPMSSLLFAGLRNIGRSHVTVESVQPLSKLLSPADRRQLLKDLPKAPRWMHPFLRLLSRTEDDDALATKGRKAVKRA